MKTQNFQNSRIQNQEYLSSTFKTSRDEDADAECLFQDAAETIRKTNTRLVFVGLGAPKQEYVIERLMVLLRGASLRATRQSHTKTEIASPSERSRNDNLILMSVGGSFDTIAGRVKRAPFLLRAIGLEWLWRLVREPWRFGRQLRLLQFLWLVFRKKERARGEV